MTWIDFLYKHLKFGFRMHIAVYRIAQKSENTIRNGIKRNPHTGIRAMCFLSNSRLIQETAIVLSSLPSQEAQEMGFEICFLRLRSLRDDRT